MPLRRGLWRAATDFVDQLPAKSREALPGLGGFLASQHRARLPHLSWTLANDNAADGWLDCRWRVGACYRTEQTGFLQIVSRAKARAVMRCSRLSPMIAYLPAGAIILGRAWSHWVRPFWTNRCPVIPAK